MNAATATRIPAPDARPAPAEDPRDTLDRKLSQAHALSLLLFGEQGETFRFMSNDDQDRVCWLMSNLIEDCIEAKTHAVPGCASEPSVQTFARELVYAHQVIAAFAGRLKEQDAPRARERTVLLGRLGITVADPRP